MRWILGAILALGICLGAHSSSSVALALSGFVPATRPGYATAPTFADVPLDHPYYIYIEALYQAGYTAGCNTDPLRYCPEATMNRAESAVFVERGIHSTSFTPPAPSSQVFADVPLDSWAAGWVDSLWLDQYTAGCGTNPLIYCPWQGHTRAEGAVFYLRMLNGADFVPPDPAQQTFADVPLNAWYAKWVHAAYVAGLIPACQTSPEPRFCPNDPLTRAMAAYMMVKAKGLPIAASPEWTQFGHDPQRTNYTPQTVNTPWRYKWQWNGAGSDGKRQANHISIPRLVQPITGGGYVYVAAGSSGIYVLDPANGSVVRTLNPGGSIEATPAYDADTSSLFALSSTGSLYKIDPRNGGATSFATNPSSSSLAPLLLSDRVIVAQGSIVYAVNKSTMQPLWSYDAGSAIQTPPAYSATRNRVIVGTQDLFVHIIDNATGQIACGSCRTKPTSRAPGNPGSSDGNNYAELLNGWPVVADTHGIVFVRYRIDWNSLWTWSPYPSTNAQIRSNLTSQQSQQVLFALDLDDGAVAFIPAVGNGGAGDGGNLPMGTQPVVRTVDGQEVAYVIWRNGQVCANQGWCDGREDAAMGEMVLDNSNGIQGCDSSGGPCSAGDLRFIKYEDIQTDEMMDITMSGDTIFHGHWLVEEAARISNRGGGFGNSFANPIQTSTSPYTIWRQASSCSPDCNCSLSTRYCSGHLYSYNDTRYYNTPGFFEYLDDSNGGSRPFAIVSADLILIKTGDGAIIALENGNPSAAGEPQMALAPTGQTSALDTQPSSPTISYREAAQYVDQQVTVEGTIASAVNHLPKAIYLGFTDPHDGALLVRIFAKDLAKFAYDPMRLKGKQVKVTGKVTLYWPEGVDPEIIVTDPSQITW